MLVCRNVVRGTYIYNRRKYSPASVLPVGLPSISVSLVCRLLSVVSRFVNSRFVIVAV